MAGVGPEAIHSVTCRRILERFCQCRIRVLPNIVIPLALYTIARCPYCLFVCQVLIRSFDFNSSDAVLMQSSAFYLWADTDRTVVRTKCRDCVKFAQICFKFRMMKIIAAKRRTACGIWLFPILVTLS